MTHIEAFKGRASFGYAYKQLQVVNNAMLFITVMQVRN